MRRESYGRRATDIAVCSQPYSSYLDLRVIIRLGATVLYTEGPLLKGAVFVISHYMFRS
jgi:hypothetical protein